MTTHKLATASRVALVTGAASGVGLAISGHLARLGHSVYLSDLDLGAATAAADGLAADGFNVTPVKLDVTSEDDVADAVAQVTAREGRLDILVNNAGLQHVAPLEDFPPARWKLLIDIMLTGPAMLTRAALPAMGRENFGRIINIGSIHSIVASPFKSAYVAAKHGLAGFAKVIALETADRDITINTICPSYIKTPLVEQQIASQARENGIPEEQVINDIMLGPMPKKRFIDTDEICGTVDFLVSDSARNMTGQEIVLDGGWTCR